MKAILTLDEMPDVCGNCFLFDVNNDTDMREICVPKYWHTNKDEKPDWCPLKELPEKVNEDGKDFKQGSFWYRVSLGWNACIDAIEEEEG